MMIAVFQLPCVLSCQLRSIGVEDDQHGETEADGIAVTLDDVGIVTFVPIDQDDDVVFLNDLGKLGVGFEQTAQFVAPASPVGAELQEESFVLRLGSLQGIGNLLFAVGGSVIKLGFGSRFSRR